MKRIELLVSSREKNGGIYRLLWENGRFSVLGFTPMPYPSYFIQKDDTLHVLQNLSMGGEKSDALVSYTLTEAGELIPRGERFWTHGLSSCHLCEREGDIFVASYTSGNLFKTPDVILTYPGSGPHPNQASPHPHCVCQTPDGRYLLVADLGTDRVTVYTPDLKALSFASVPPGHGARHLAFLDEKTLLCVNELASTVTVFHYENGTLTAGETVSSLPRGFAGESFAGAIRVAGKSVLVSNRGHNSVALLLWDGKRLSLADVCGCGGDFPRDIFVLEPYVFSANQLSDTLTVLSLSDNRLTLTEAVFPVTCPMCILPI